MLNLKPGLKCYQTQISWTKSVYFSLIKNMAIEALLEDKFTFITPRQNSISTTSLTIGRRPA